MTKGFSVWEVPPLKEGIKLTTSTTLTEEENELPDACRTCRYFKKAFVKIYDAGVRTVPYCTKHKKQVNLDDTCSDYYFFAEYLVKVLKE